MKILVQSAGQRADEAGLGARGLAVLEEEINRLENLTRTFLDFARPPQLEKRPVDVRTVIEDAVGLVAGRARRCGVQVTGAAPASPVLLRADAGLLRQLLLNLLLNALEALPGGGSVVVELLVPEGGRALTLRVADSGAGLAAGREEDIFRPFVSTKPTGLGLGLSICRRIVEAHGGTIEAANRPEGGAVFTVRLPREGPEPAAPGGLVDAKPARR
jgi:signal transduction histidine kinase